MPDQTSSESHAGSDKTFETPLDCRRQQGHAPGQPPQSRLSAQLRSRSASDLRTRRRGDFQALLRNQQIIPIQSVDAGAPLIDRAEYIAEQVADSIAEHGGFF